MANKIHLASIVYTLNNTGEYHNRSALVSLTIQILLNIPGTLIKSYISELGYFNEADLKLLHDRILNKRNKEVAMNEKHFIIYNASFQVVKKILLDEEGSDAILLREAHQLETEKTIFKVKDLMLEFIRVGEKLFKADYKNNHRLSAALAKIY